MKFKSMTYDIPCMALGVNMCVWSLLLCVAETTAFMCTVNALPPPTPLDM